MKRSQKHGTVFNVVTAHRTVVRHSRMSCSGTKRTKVKGESQDERILFFLLSLRPLLTWEECDRPRCWPQKRQLGLWRRRDLCLCL